LLRQTIHPINKHERIRVHPFHPRQSWQHE
jgi:hypothetical protein